MLVGFDTETWMITPGMLTPPLVVSSVAAGPDAVALFHRASGVDTFEALLDAGAVLAIHNAAFDVAVMCNERPALLPKVVAAYDAGHIRCTLVREVMIHNAIHGLVEEGGPPVKFDLARVLKRRFDVDISASKGEDAWRTRYRELYDVPLDDWPEEARAYAQDDALWHRRLYEAQEADSAYLVDENGQHRAAFVLHLMACYGLLTDEEAVQNLEAVLTKHVDEANESLAAAGLLKPKRERNKITGLMEVGWAKDTKAIRDIIVRTLGDAAPRTEPTDKFPDGQIKTDEETLRATGDPNLEVLADVGNDAKMLSVWVPALKGEGKDGKPRGLRLATGWLLQPKWNVLVSSGRTSVFAPPVQQPPRKGNVRSCFVPRPGYWYCSVDYSFIELVTWAQTCLDLFGYSDLAEAIRRGLDPHVDMGVEILRAEGRNVDYAQVNAARKAGAAWAKDARQLAKAANFGLPGGLGAKTFCAFAKASYGVVIEEEGAWRLKDTWKRKWRESEAYFAHVGEMADAAFGERFQVALPRTGFVRGGCTYTSACNTYFQGLAARGAKEAMWDAMKEQYLDATSPLFGCRTVLFLHDELIMEVPAHRETASAAAKRLVEVMERAMSRFTPDVPVKAEPALCARWYKDAEPVWAPDGTLELWTPKGGDKNA